MFIYILPSLQIEEEDLKACIAYAADCERRFMTAPFST
jgi:hypothetical protein